MVLAQAPATPGNADFARLLLSRGVNVLAQNSAGLTVYHLACQLNRIELLRMVLEHSKGVGASVLSAADETPVYVCCKHGHFDCLELLLACDDRDLTATISVVGAPRAACVFIHTRGQTGLVCGPSRDPASRCRVGPISKLHCGAVESRRRQCERGR